MRSVHQRTNYPFNQLHTSPSARETPSCFARHDPRILTEPPDTAIYDVKIFQQSLNNYIQKHPEKHSPRPMLSSPRFGYNYQNISAKQSHQETIYRRKSYSPLYNDRAYVPVQQIKYRKITDNPIDNTFGADITNRCPSQYNPSVQDISKKYGISFQEYWKKGKTASPLKYTPQKVCRVNRPLPQKQHIFQQVITRTPGNQPEQKKLREHNFNKQTVSDGLREYDVQASKNVELHYLKFQKPKTSANEFDESWALQRTNLDLNTGDYATFKAHLLPLDAERSQITKHQSTIQSINNIDEMINEKLRRILRSDVH